MLKSKVNHNESHQPSAISHQPSKILPVLSKIKSAYLLWFESYSKLPKTHRHSLGERIDTLFVDIIEAISVASFLSKEEKLPWVRLAIRKLDTITILLLVLWEAKSLETKKYVSLSLPLAEIGKMLGGWSGQLAKQNSPAVTREK